MSDKKIGNPNLVIIPADPEKFKALEEERYREEQEFRARMTGDFVDILFSQDEQKLILLFRELSDRGQAVAINQIAALTKIFPANETK